MPQTNSTKAIANPNKSRRAKKTSKNGVVLNKLLDGYALARLKELGVCLVIPRKGYALKELKEVGWPKQTLGKEMN